MPAKRPIGFTLLALFLWCLSFAGIASAGAQTVSALHSVHRRLGCEVQPFVGELRNQLLR